MPKLYVIMEGLIGVTTPTGTNTMVLLVKTYPTDRDGLGQPLMQHFPKVAFRTGGQLTTKDLNGEDIRFDTGQANAPLGKDFSRIPPFSRILAFAPASNGGQRGANAQINAGCIGGAPGTACLVPGQKNPRLAGRVLIDHGKLTSIQVGIDGNPTNDPPTRFKFQFTSNSNAPALDMHCDNALLLKIDSGASPITMIVGQESLTLSNAAENEKLAVRAILDDPAEDCVIVRVTDMVDPVMAQHMAMNQNADVHFPILFDLVPSYKGSRVIPSVVHRGAGDPPLSRCIPPVI